MGLGSLAANNGPRWAAPALNWTDPLRLAERADNLSAPLLDNCYDFDAEKSEFASRPKRIAKRVLLWTGGAGLHSGRDGPLTAAWRRAYPSVSNGGFPRKRRLP